MFFDFLNGHVKDTDGTVRPRYTTVIPNAILLMEAAREHGLLIAYAAANHRADNGTSGRVITDTDNRLNPKTPVAGDRFNPGVFGGTWRAQVIDELQPSPQDYIIPKYRWNAFYQTYLDLALRNRQIDTIIIAGGSTDVGVASTAFAARDMDYNLIVVSDACTSPEQDNHHQFMTRIFPRMSRVRSTEQVLELISASSVGV